jgi:hypothetical protein
MTGKTARMLHELRDEKRVILVDPKCAQLVKLKGWKHVWGEYDKEGKCFKDSAISNVLRPVLHSPFRICVHFKNHYQDSLNLLCRQVMAVKDCVLAVDELGLFVPPGSAGCMPAFITAVAISGTHEGIRFIGTAQRISLVHLTLRSNWGRMLIYRMNEDYEVDKCRRFLPADLAEQVKTLPDYVCIDYVDGRDPFVDTSLVGKLKTLPGPRFKSPRTAPSPEPVKQNL